MFPANPILFLFVIVTLFLVLRFLLKTSLLHILIKSWQSLESHFHVYQFYKVPQFNDHFQENQLYRKVSTYLNSLASVEDSDFTNLYSGSKSNDILLHLDANQIVRDTFLSAKVSWKIEESEDAGTKSFVLKIRKSDKRRILRPYLQHIHTTSDEIEQRRKDLKLYMNLEGSKSSSSQSNGRWRSIPFAHPATMDTVVMDGDLKNKVRSDLENFLKSKQYYHKLGRVWKRSYLLYGPPGTGKSSFVAAMARFLCYDVYDIDMRKVIDSSDLKMLLLQTTSKSMIVIEDLDLYLGQKSTAVSLSAVLNFMDGIISCCGEERVMVFTMKGKDGVDEAVIRPGRVDVHVQFPLCDFGAFKTLATNYLGVKEHRLFGQIDELFQTGVSLSPAEISEIMISNRSSPSRALKSVLAALQTSADSRGLSKSGSGRSGDELGSGETENVIAREGVYAVKEFKKIYGLLRRSKREEPLDAGHTAHTGLGDKEGSRHQASCL